MLCASHFYMQGYYPGHGNLRLKKFTSNQKGSRGIDYLDRLVQGNEYVGVANHTSARFSLRNPCTIAHMLSLLKKNELFSLELWDF